VNYIVVGWGDGEPHYATRFETLDQAIAWGEACCDDGDYRVYRAELVATGRGVPQ
jgi:hypothetical protein